MQDIIKKIIKILNIIKKETIKLKKLLYFQMNKLPNLKNMIKNMIKNFLFIKNILKKQHLKYFILHLLFYFSKY